MARLRGFKHSEETKRKMSEVRKKLIREKKIFLWHEGKKIDFRKYPNWGKRGKKGIYSCSEETKRKIGKANKGKRSSKRTEFKKGHIPWIKGKKGVTTAWNKGLTKDTGKRVKRISNSRKKAWQNEEYRNSMTGKNNPMFGKKRPDAREYMLNGGSAHSLSFIKNPSKPQVELFNFVRKIYPTAKLNYGLKVWGSRWYSLDVAVPELKVNFEYDEPFWHSEKNFGGGSEVKDFFRDEALMERGWCVVRVRGKEELKYVLEGG